jgi:hypothetical protein
MSRKEVLQAQHRFVPAKKAEPARESQKFIDSVRNQEDLTWGGINTETWYKDSGKIVPKDTEGAFAKKVVDEKNNVGSYFIKVGTTGPAVGRLLNPWGVNYREGDDVKYESQMGRHRYEFERVSKEVFEAYIKFLKTRNERYLLTAERNKN